MFLYRKHAKLIVFLISVQKSKMTLNMKHMEYFLKLLNHVFLLGDSFPFLIKIDNYGDCFSSPLYFFQISNVFLSDIKVNIFWFTQYN